MFKKIEAEIDLQFNLIIGLFQKEELCSHGYNQ